MARGTLVIGLYLLSIVAIADLNGRNTFCSSDDQVIALLGDQAQFLALDPYSCIDKKFLQAKYSDEIYSVVRSNPIGINKLRCDCFNDIKENNDLSEALKPSTEEAQKLRREKIAEIIERSVENMAQQIMPVIDLSPASASKVAGICSVSEIKCSGNKKPDEELVKILAARTNNSLAPGYQSDVSGDRALFDALQKIYARNFSRGTAQFEDQKSCFSRPDQFSAKRVAEENTAKMLLEKHKQDLSDSLFNLPVAEELKSNPIFSKYKTEELQEMLTTVTNIERFVNDESRGVGATACIPKENTEYVEHLTEICSKTKADVQKLLCNSPDDIVVDDINSFEPQVSDSDEKAEYKVKGFALYCEDINTKKPLTKETDEDFQSVILDNLDKFKTSNSVLNFACEEGSPSGEFRTGYCDGENKPPACEEDPYTKVENIQRGIDTIANIKNSYNDNQCSNIANLDPNSYGQGLRSSVMKELLGAVQDANGNFQVATFNAANAKLVQEVFETNNLGGADDVKQINPTSQEAQDVKIATSTNPETPSPVSTIETPDITPAEAQRINDAYRDIARQQQGLSAREKAVIDAKQSLVQGQERVQKLNSEIASQAVGETKDRAAELREQIAKTRRELSDQEVRSSTEEDFQDYLRDFRAFNEGKAPTEDTAKLESELAELRSALITSSRKSTQDYISNVDNRTIINEGFRTQPINSPAISDGRVESQSLDSDKIASRGFNGSGEGETATGSATKAVAADSKNLNPTASSNASTPAEPISQIQLQVDSVSEGLNQDILTYKFIEVVGTNPLNDEVEVEITDSENNKIKVIVSGIYSENGPQVLRALNGQNQEIDAAQFAIISQSFKSALVETSKQASKRLSADTLRALMSSSLIGIQSAGAK